MKLNLNTDFTKFPRAVSVLAAGEARAAPAFAKAVLAHDERHLRRRAIELSDGSKVLVDLPEPVALNDGDRLVLEDGRHVEIIAAPEEVYDIRARDGVHLTELAWHIGNRHLAAGIEADRIVILRDHVIKAMLEGLGATVREVSEPFKPVRGAYSGGHDHGHAHAHSHTEAHSHAHSGSHSHAHSHSHDDHHHHDHD
ncbi:MULTISPECIES: urease accessory protein UreE [unclassified Mesorhizobium]|uniref:urease accessory protein UreE n=1 Tax=unclassified Mesorhizobium TaxID=325217 RepID=UPI000BB08DA8|nr:MULTISPECIES: urease accessory protein UreE [unclassified Mesorhizobium]PBB25287.1 urease accessory protein UreE [Mesorhizobium sp. WSM4304]PBB74886.1 urease accessory protein UreE [Mesorhizobium sp. WSM4308]